MKGHDIFNESFNHVLWFKMKKGLIKYEGLQLIVIIMILTNIL